MWKHFFVLCTIFISLMGQSPGGRYVNISFSGLFSAGTSTLTEPAIATFEGGAHDPKKKGFTVQNLELSFTGAVDPRFYAESHLIFQITPEGESILEVEEAFILTQSLPFGLQVKAGTFFTEFGRLNPQHPHSWSFVDQPIINTRLFGGDGLRGPGTRFSWLTPFSWYSELIMGVQNANGETMVSFLSSDEEKTFAGYPFIERDTRSLRDLLWTARMLNTLTLGETITTNLGISGLWGPNRTGTDNRTRILGADIYLKWKPLLNDRGFPFIAFQGEAMTRIYETDRHPDQGLLQESLRDNGFYAQLLWGFTRGLVIGFKTERATGDGGRKDDPFRDQRTRQTVNLTWYPSEFSKIRFNYNLEQAEHKNNFSPYHSLWLQFEFLIGQHGGHKF